MSEALAQGHHPFAFALAELVDNSLRATRANTARDRNIRISLVLHPDSDEGLISVSMCRLLQATSAHRMPTTFDSLVQV